jgi:protein phosphatase 1L
MEDVYVAQKFQDPKEATNVRNPVPTTVFPPSSHHFQSVCFFGVFDGHSGRRACEYARDNLPRQVQAELSKAEPDEALRRAFLKTDEEFLKIANKEGLGDGSTAITALVRGRTLWVANAGDARAILVSGSTAIAMSEDHKPNRESERRRITQAGGTVTFMGCWRVNGVLATSRGFGDRELKKVVSAEPEIRHRTLMEGDDYLVLASDGIWDVLSNQIVAEIVARSGGCRAAASAVTEEALRRGSMDNVTAVVISLRSIWGGSELPTNQPAPHRAGDTPRSSLGSASFGEIPPAATSPLAGRRAVPEAADGWPNKSAFPLRASADGPRHGPLSANGENPTPPVFHRPLCASALESNKNITVVQIFLLWVLGDRVPMQRGCRWRHRPSGKFPAPCFPLRSRFDFVAPAPETTIVLVIHYITCIL